MAINQLNDYSVGDASIDDVMVTLDATRRGHIALTLTNMDSTGVPAIAAGSIVEVGGALFEFTTDTALSGSPSDGTVYIKLVPSGTAPTITLTPTMTNTAPTWSDAKQGWYGTLTAAGDRYVGRMVKSSASYTQKNIFGFFEHKSVMITATGPGNFIVPYGVTKIKAKLQGAGGGGAKALSLSTVPAGGGGGGCYIENDVNVYFGQTISYSVGAGGSGGVASSYDAGNGGNTTLGTLTAPGGSGGTTVAAGSGGTTSGYDIIISGQDGAGVSIGTGGKSFLGHGGFHGVSSGQPGYLGGGGGSVPDGSTNGGRGGDGAIIIEYIISL